MSDDGGALDALKQCRAQLRRTEFGPNLLETVRAFEPTWRGFSPTSDEYWRGRSVAAEVLDYFGFYADAANAVAEPGNALWAGMRTNASEFRPKSDTDSGPAHRIAFLLQYANAAYRAEDYGRAEAVLEQCCKFIDTAPAGTFLGLRCRIAYTFGQIHRQQNRFDLARTDFTDSIRWAQERFRRITPFAEYREAPTALIRYSAAESEIFENSRLVTQWSIAKALTLGIGWVEYSVGRLESAAMCLHSGYAILRTTGDWLHRAYCQLLLSAVERARFTYDSGRLGQSIEAMEEAANGLRSHVGFAVRVALELALAYLHSGDLVKARAQVAELERLLDGSNTGDLAHAAQALIEERPMEAAHDVTSIIIGRRSRWWCHARTIESRIECRARNLGRAQDLARQSIETSGREGHIGCHADALIALAEALIAEAASLPDNVAARVQRLEGAVASLTEALAVNTANPRIEAVCYLHLASAYADLQRFELAYHAYARWDLQYRPVVEHGFIRQILADQVASKLKRAAPAPFYIDAHENDLTVDRWQERLKSFLTNASIARGGSREDQARRLGIAPRSLQYWISQHEGARRPGRPKTGGKKKSRGD